MKEFVAQDGGRYTYADDIINLQNLALSFSSMFDGCGNFIVSGCNIVGNDLTAGYVYINGKLRACDGRTNVGSFPVYICEQNTIEQVSYVDAGGKSGRNVYGCVVSSSPITAKDPITNKVPQYITIDKSNKAYRIGDAFFGKYSLIHKSDHRQNVSSSILFTGEVTHVDNARFSNIEFLGGKQSGSLSYDKGFIIENTGSFVPTENLRLALQQDGFLTVTNTANTVLMKVGTEQTEFSGSVCSTSRFQVSSVLLNGSGIYNIGSQDNSLGINYPHNTNAYHATIIGNGMGGKLATFDGSTPYAVDFNGPVLCAGPNPSVIIQDHSTNGLSLRGMIQWVNSSHTVVSQIGYVPSEPNVLQISNTLGGKLHIYCDTQIDGDVRIAQTLTTDQSILSKGSITISNNASVGKNFTVTGDANINGKLYLNGENIKTYCDDRYVRKWDLEISLPNYVYSQAESNERFITKLDSKQKLESYAYSKPHIDYNFATIQSLKRHPLKSELLRDVVYHDVSGSDEVAMERVQQNQLTICSHIGAMPQKDMKPVLIEGTAEGENKAVSNITFSRSGHVVVVQGQVSLYVLRILSKNGAIVLFKIPDTLPTPLVKVHVSFWSSCTDYAEVMIEKGSRRVYANVSKNSSLEEAIHLSPIYFQLTYITNT